MASRGLNKVTLIGNVGADPETRHTQDNVMVVNLRMATTEVWNDRQNNERQEKTEWHRVIFFRRLAEIVDKWVRKGSSIYIEGKLQTRKWHDQRTGQDRYTTEIIASEMLLLDRAGGDDTRTQSSYGGGSANQPASKSDSSSAGGGETRTIDDEFDDDVPW